MVDLTGTVATLACGQVALSLGGGVELAEMEAGRVEDDTDTLKFVRAQFGREQSLDTSAIASTRASAPDRGLRARRYRRGPHASAGSGSLSGAGFGPLMPDWAGLRRST